MKSFLKKHFAVVLAFLLPIILIVIVALSTYLPSLSLSTDYNFVYTSCTEGTSYSYYCDTYLQKRYSVVDGKLVLNEVSPLQDSDKDGIPDVDENYDARLFFHDTTLNESREITLEEAQALVFSDLITSPDGVSISSDYDRAPDFLFLFGGGSSYGHYLTKGSSKRELNIINKDDRYYYRDSFEFIGWVLPEIR